MRPPRSIVPTRISERSRHIILKKQPRTRVANPFKHAKPGTLPQDILQQISHLDFLTYRNLISLKLRIPTTSEHEQALDMMKDALTSQRSRMQPFIQKMELQPKPQQQAESESWPEFFKMVDEQSTYKESSSANSRIFDFEEPQDLRRIQQEHGLPPSLFRLDSYEVFDPDEPNYRSMIIS